MHFQRETVYFFPQKRDTEKQSVNRYKSWFLDSTNMANFMAVKINKYIFNEIISSIQFNNFNRLKIF